MNKEKIEEHLQFTFKERLAFLIILLVVTIVFAYPYLFSNQDEQPLTIIKSSPVANTTAEEKEGDYNHNSNYKRTTYSPNNYEPKTNIRMFYFDPNTATEEQWQTLGIRDRTIHTIKNYLSKGGSFKTKEDLQKIYGLHEDEYARLEPYIRIVAKENAKPSYKDFSTDQPYTKPIKKTGSLVINDINTADANAFIALPGIGEKLANRIINFRDKLGGFHSIEQVGETYALPDSTFQLIKTLLQINSPVKKLNVNTASKDELKSHPYIRWNLANAIVEYRNQHGAFKDLEELKNIVVIDDATFNKIKPYLTL